MPAALPETAPMLLQRIDSRLAEMDRSRYWLDKQVTGGSSTKVVKEIERKGTIPREPRLRAIAKTLGVSLDYLMGRSEDPDPVKSEVALREAGGAFTHRPANPFKPLPAIPLVGTGDCADLQFETETGELVDIERSSFDPDHTVRLIERPPALKGAKDIYAIYFQGESMLPRYEPGEVALIDPTRPAGPGDYVLVQLNNGTEDDVTSVLVKRLVSANSKTVALRQLNPDITFNVPRRRIARMHRIMPQIDLLFG